MNKIHKKINPIFCLLGLKLAAKKKYDVLIHMAGNNKIRPIIDWYPIIWGYIESIFDGVNFEK